MEVWLSKEAVRIARWEKAMMRSAIVAIFILAPHHLTFTQRAAEALDHDSSWRDFSTDSANQPEADVSSRAIKETAPQTLRTLSVKIALERRDG